jgi:ABC-type multidrug transport system fused ATPase/permease subunit
LIIQIDLGEKNWILYLEMCMSSKDIKSVRRFGTNEDEILQYMSDEDMMYISRLQRMGKINSLVIMMILVIIPLTILFILSFLNRGKEYLTWGFLLIFLLLHAYMMRGMFKRRL